MNVLDEWETDPGIGRVLETWGRAMVTAILVASLFFVVYQSEWWQTYAIFTGFLLPWILVKPRLFPEDD